MKELKNNQSRFVTIQENGIPKKLERMTMEQYQCSECSNAFYLDGAGEGRKYFRPLKSYINANGRYEEVYASTIIYVEI